MKNPYKIISITLTLLLFLSMQVWAASPGIDKAHPNQYIPVKAANVEMVKKVTVKGATSKPAKGNSYAATGIIGEPLASGGTKYAIVIGINDYPGTSSDLQYAIADVNSVIDSLTNYYGFKTSNIIILKDVAASGTNIMNAINDMKTNLKAGDELVFYYSGHGAKGRAADGDSNNADQSIVVCNDDHSNFQYIWDGTLKEWFTGFKTNRIIFGFDSCLSGGMTVLKESGRVVNMGCTSTGYSYEGSQWGGGHGQFTYYFIVEGLGKMGQSPADIRPLDQKVSVEEAFDYTKANCVQQTPTIADGFDKDLIL